MTTHCITPDCKREPAPGEPYCDDCLVKRFIDAYLARYGKEPAFCRHPENCKAKAHNPGDPIAPDFRHCVDCANGE